MKAFLWNSMCALVPISVVLAISWRYKTDPDTADAERRPTKLKHSGLWSLLAILIGIGAFHVSISDESPFRPYIVAFVVAALIERLIDIQSLIEFMRK